MRHCLQKLVLKTKQHFLYLLLSPVCITSQGPLPILVMGDVWVPYINLEIHVQRLLSADMQQPLAGSTAMAGCGQPSHAAGTLTINHLLFMSVVMLPMGWCFLTFSQYTG